MDEPTHLVYYDERMERDYLVYYDETGDPLFVVYDEDGDPMFRFGRLNRAERKALETSLRTELAALNRRIEELERETEGEDAIAQGVAINQQLEAEGWQLDLDEALDDLGKIRAPAEGVSDFLMTYGLFGWFGLLVVGAVLVLAGVIRTHDWGGVYFIGAFAIVGVAWLVAELSDRLG